MCAPRADGGEQSAQAVLQRYEVDVVEGLEPIARDELQRHLGARIHLRDTHISRRAPSTIQFDYSGAAADLLHLRTVLAAYVVHHVAVPRPRALLADGYMRTLLAQIAAIRTLVPATAYRTLALSAAGADSAVFTRLKTELAQRTGLTVAPEEGDLYLRVRRPVRGDAGWEVLIRLTPRPLATRPWRVCNPKGALNGTVASAMVLMTRPRPDDIFLNLGCGSGTLLIERVACMPCQRAIGCDISAAARDAAITNVAASPYTGQIEIYGWDARMLPLPDQSVDTLCADLPFGHVVGSHDENTTLYPQILGEAARVAQAGARFVVMTHEVRLMEQVLDQTDEWVMESHVRVRVGGLYPRVFVLHRR